MIHFTICFYFVALYQCGEPPKVNHATTQLKKMGKEAEYRCDNDYIPQGHTIVTCQRSGKWEKPALVCICKCNFKVAISSPPNYYVAS